MFLESSLCRNLFKEPCSLVLLPTTKNSESTLDSRLEIRGCLLHGTLYPLWWLCGCVCVHTPYFLCCDFRTTVIYGRGSLGIIWAGNCAATVSYLLGENVEIQFSVAFLYVCVCFYLSCFWNTVLFCTLLSGTAMYLNDRVFASPELGPFSLSCQI